MTRRRKIVLGVTLALALGFGLAIWRGVSPLFAEPTVTTNYVAEFNAEIEQIPDEDRAWPLYVEAYGQVGASPDDLTTVNDELRQWVAAHAAAAEIIRQAAARPHIGAPLSDVVSPEMSRAGAARVGSPAPTDFPEAAENPMVLSVLLPQLGATRAFNRLLVAEALAAADDGNGALAAENIAAMVGLARHARDYPLLICDLVSFAAVQLAWETLARCLQGDPDLFSADSLAQMRLAFAAFGGGERLPLRLEWEQKLYLDLIQRIYTDDGRGNGRMTRQGLELINELGGSLRHVDGSPAGGSPLARFDVWKYADRREAVELYERLMAAAEEDFSRPPWQRDPPIYVPVRDEVFEQSDTNPLLRLIVGAYTRAAETADEATLHRDAALIMLAVAQRRLDTGAWPGSLDSLVPEYLDAVPVDPADGAPLRYTLRDGEPHERRLYSVGPDATDDNGEGDDILLFPLPPDE